MSPQKLSAIRKRVATGKPKPDDAATLLAYADQLDAIASEYAKKLGTAEAVLEGIAEDGKPWHTCDHATDAADVLARLREYQGGENA